MLFLREFTYGQVAIVLMLHVCFIKIIVSEDCEKAFGQIAVKQERGRPCVYVEKSGLKFIGWKFALNQGQQARAVFTHLGADYGQFFKGPVTLSDARCECNKVPCLNKQQMNKLLTLSVERSLRDTLTIVPSLKNLCCSLQIRILLLAFTSGGRIFKNLASPDIEYHIKMQSWFAFSQLLTHTEWCRNYQEVCTEQTRGIVDGCADYREVRGKRDKRGINLLKSKENATCAGNTCHKESSTSVLKPSVTIGAIQSTAKNKLIPVQPSRSRRSPMGTSSAATPINAGNSNGDSQLLLRPSHIQMPDVNQMTRGTDFFTANVSSVATKSLGKDVQLRMTSMSSSSGYSQGYFYYDVSATSSPNHQSPRGQNTQTSKISYGLSSTDWLSLTPSSKFLTEIAKPSSGILSNSLKLWSTTSETEIVSRTSSWSFHRKSSVLKTGMAFSSLELKEYLSTTSKTPTGQKLQFQTSLSQVPLKFAESPLPTTSSSKSLSLAVPLETPFVYQTRNLVKFAASPLVHKDWSSSLKYDSENSPILLSNTLQVSKTQLTEERGFLTSPWPLEQRTVQRTSSISKARTISSSLGGKSPLSTASASNTTITASSSFDTLPSQVLLTSYSFGFTHSVSQVLQTKTSLNVAELQPSPTLSMIHDKWASSPTPGKKLVTETTKSAYVIRRNASQFSRTQASLSLEVADVSLTSWPLHQTSAHRPSSLLKKEMGSSPLKRTKSLSTSSMASNSHKLLFETSLTQVLGTKTTQKFPKSLFAPTLASKTSLNLALPLETPSNQKTRTVVKLFAASHMVRKYWSSSLKFDSENSPIVLSSTLQISKTRSIEKREFLTSPWQPEQRTVHRTRSVSKARTISSSLGGKSLSSTASASNTTITASSSINTLPSQVLLTSYFPGITHSVSQVLQTKTSLNVAELQPSPTLSMIHDGWASSQTPGKKLVTETTKSASVIRRNASQFSRTRASLPLEVANVSSPWLLLQSSFYRTDSVLKAGMTSFFIGPKPQLSAISASQTSTAGLDLTIETFQSQVLLTSSSLVSLKYPASTTSTSRTSNDSESSFGTFLSQVVQSNTPTSFAEISSLTKAVIHKMYLSSRIKRASRLVSLQSSLASNTPSQKVSSSISKSWSTHAHQKSELTGPSTLTRLSEVTITQSARLSTASSSGNVLAFHGSSKTPQKFSSASREVPSKLRVLSVHSESVVLGSTISLRNSSNFTSTIYGQTSRTSLILESSTMHQNSSRSQDVKPGQSYNPSVSSLYSYSSVRASSPEKTRHVHVMSSILSPVRGLSSSILRKASVSSTVILDVKITKQLQNTVPRTLQTRHTLSSVFAVRSMKRALSIRTSDATAWSSTLSPSVGPLPRSSPSTTMTIVTKMMTNTSRSDSLANLPYVLTGTPSFAVSSLSSGKKATTVNAVSIRTRRPYRSSQATSSLRLTLGLPLQTSQRMASVLDHSSTPTLTERSVVRTQSFPKRHTGTRLRSSYDLKSAAIILSSSPSANLPFSRSSSLYTTPQSVAPVVPTPSILPSFSSSELAATSSVLGFAKYDQTYLVILSGNCTMLENEDDFSSQFKAVLTGLLYVRAADISVLKISCGSVHVMFSIREAKRRNITKKLRDIVESKLFKFQYNNITFEALEVSEISAKPSGTTTRPSRTTHTSRTPEAKQIALIIFFLVLSFFAALSVLLAVIFCIRFCRCCQKRERSRKRKKTPAEVELKIFSSLYNNLFRKVDYYGGSRQLPRTPSKDKHEEFELADIENQQVSTATALLSETQKVADEEKKFSFDDDDSCASVLFY